MKPHKLLILCFGFSLSVSANNDMGAERLAAAEDTQELPKILYVVPWKDSKNVKAANPKLVLHDLMGDLYEPQLASDWE
jgi:hypothetical protein